MNNTNEGSPAQGETPRTDAVLKKVAGCAFQTTEMRDHARQLEREIAQLTSERDEALQEAQEQARLLGMGGSREAAPVVKEVRRRYARAVLAAMGLNGRASK